MRLASEGVKVQRDASFAKLTTFRVGGPAALLVEPDDDDQLALAASAAMELGCETIAIGRGSNILMSDDGFPGMVIRLGKGFTTIDLDDSEMQVGAAVPLPQAANRAARAGLSGLEFSVAIPGSVGGAVRMNAGAHNSCMADVLIQAWVLDLTSGEVVTSRREDLGLSYRHSNLDDRSVVTRALLGLVPAETELILSRMQANRDHRTRTQPVDAPNAGSMFANPIDDSAGRLIQTSGANSIKIGMAAVSPKHANFFLARDGARAQDVFDLMAMVQDQVLRETGVLLRPEVRVIGAFEGRDRLSVSS